MSAIEHLRTRLADPEAEISLREIAAALLELAPEPPEPAVNRVSFDPCADESEDDGPVAAYLVEWKGRGVWLYDEDDPALFDCNALDWFEDAQIARDKSKGDLVCLGEIVSRDEARDIIQGHRRSL